MFAAAAQARSIFISRRTRRGRQQRVERECLVVRAGGGRRRRQARTLAATAMATAARPWARRSRKILPAGVRGARRPPPARVPGLLPAAANLPAAAALRVSATPATAALVGYAGVREPAAAHAWPLGPTQARNVPQPGCTRHVGRRPAGAARRVQPLHEQGARDPLAGVPAERAATAACGCQAAQVPQPAEQDSRA